MEEEPIVPEAMTVEDLLHETSYRYYRPHTLIWAKAFTYPHYPAYISNQFDQEAKKFPVAFFDAEEQSNLKPTGCYLPINNICPYEFPPSPVQKLLEALANLPVAHKAEDFSKKKKKKLTDLEKKLQHAAKIKKQMQRAEEYKNKFPAKNSAQDFLRKGDQIQYYDPAKVVAKNSIISAEIKQVFSAEKAHQVNYPIILTNKTAQFSANFAFGDPPLDSLIIKLGPQGDVLCQHRLEDFFFIPTNEEDLVEDKRAEEELKIALKPDINTKFSDFASKSDRNSENNSNSPVSRGLHWAAVELSDFSNTEGEEAEEDKDNSSRVTEKQRVSKRKAALLFSATTNDSHSTTSVPQPSAIAVKPSNKRSNKGKNESKLAALDATILSTPPHINLQFSQSSGGNNSTLSNNMSSLAGSHVTHSQLLELEQRLKQHMTEEFMLLTQKLIDEIHKTK
jgi:hypothetical protein